MSFRKRKLRRKVVRAIAILVFVTAGTLASMWAVDLAPGSLKQLLVPSK